MDEDSEKLQEALHAVLADSEQIFFDYLTRSKNITNCATEILVGEMIAYQEAHNLAELLLNKIVVHSHVQASALRQNPFFGSIAETLCVPTDTLVIITRLLLTQCHSAEDWRIAIQLLLEKNFSDAT